MRRKTILTGISIVLVILVVTTTAFAATIDSGTRTVTTGQLFVDWADANPEAIVDIRWKSSPNLTNTAVISGCPDALEYFGNSWVSQDEGTSGFVFASLVGWGTTGSWTNPSHNKISLDSNSAGCPASAGIPVHTDYRFYDDGPTSNRIQIKRRFSFGSTPFPYNFRPYIPRLYPLSDYTQALHPDASGTTLVTETAASCEFGCQVNDWDGSWFAIHNPTTGQGLIVRRESSPIPAALWIDQDQASFTAASSALLLPPSGGFTGTVTETEFLCFYDSSTWTPATTLPPGC